MVLPLRATALVVATRLLAGCNVAPAPLPPQRPPSVQSARASGSATASALPVHDTPPPPAAPTTPDAAMSEDDAWTAPLPAVSEDGRLVAAAVRVMDGARGSPNLALDILDVDRDRIVEHIVVVDPEDPNAPGRDDRVNAALAALARHRWRKLAPYELAEDPLAPERETVMGGSFRAQQALGEGLAVEYLEPTLIVKIPHVRVLLRAPVPSWSARGGRRCAGCDPCPAPKAALASAFGSRADGVLLVIVGYHGGTDICWEPDETPHAVRFPRG